MLYTSCSLDIHLVRMLSCHSLCARSLTCTRSLQCENSDGKTESAGGLQLVSGDSVTVHSMKEKVELNGIQGQVLTVVVLKPETLNPKP